MSKFIDLTDKIYNSSEMSSVDRLYKSRELGLLSLGVALRWLDEHPDQVPGRTITESELVEHWEVVKEMGLGGLRAFARIAGASIVPDPDPKPTNVEKLASVLNDADWAMGFNIPPNKIAAYLDERGVKADG